MLLAAGAVLSLLLSVSTSLVGAPLFVLVLVATAFVTTGAWPLIVDSALARTEPSHRAGARPSPGTSASMASSPP